MTDQRDDILSDIAVTPIQPMNVQKTLRKYGLKPQKGLGQNFLSDDEMLEKICVCAGFPPVATVLEIGPGLGSLTRHLANRAAKVVAVELDQKLIPILRDVLAPWQNVTIVHGDILTVNLEDILSQDAYYVVANIPYYITSAVIRHLLTGSVKPVSLALTVQAEVAERICAAPGKMNLLALSAQLFGAPDIPLRIPAAAFYPEPAVDSAVARIQLFPQPIVPEEEMDAFFTMAKAGFGQKRKMLRNALSSNLRAPVDQIETILKKAGIDPMRRAETLSIEEWRTLTLLSLKEKLI